MKKMSAFLVLLFLMSTYLVAQEDNTGSNYYGQQNAICNQMSYYQDTDVEQLIKTMLDKIGTQPNFAVVECPDINNCQAVVKDGIPYIVYDSHFLSGIKGLNFTVNDLPRKSKDWEALSVLAHEIGHHYNQHLTNRLVRKSKTPVEMELEADEFSGFMLFLLGATLQQAQLAMNSPFISDHGSYSHPARSKRLDSIDKGWKNAKQQYGTKSSATTTSELTDRDGDGILNDIDSCPDEKGTLKNEGCPEITPAKITTKRDLPNLPEMVFVKGGTFTMGDVFGDGEADEKPTHEVTVSDFYIGKYEITFEEYDLFCEATGRNKPDDESWGREKQPVINVSWEDAKAYCTWASNISGKRYSLPTEAQWEYAARSGGGKVRFGNGKNLLDPSEANFDGSDGKQEYSLLGVYREKTLPVGSFSGNSLGLYDMAGNVWEWCSDWYDGDYYRVSPSNNPQGMLIGSRRVLRGGSWGNQAKLCRTTVRDNGIPNLQIYFTGFRVVVAP